MVNNKFILFMAMLVVAIVAVGSASAAEDVAIDDADISTSDIQVDEIVVDEPIMQTQQSTVVIPDGRNSTYINEKIDEVAANGGGDIYFTANGNYTNISVTLKNNVNLYGNGANINGTGSATVFAVDNTENIGIYNFTINSKSFNTASAIYGQNVTNATIKYNTIYNAKDGVSFYKRCHGATIENNTIYQIKRDAISLANPQIALGNYVESSIKYNTIYSDYTTTMEYGVFVGGNFKGEVSHNTIYDVACAMQFVGKPSATAGQLNAVIYKNNITDVTYGIDMSHPDVQFLNITSNNITASAYSIYNDTSFANVSASNIYVIGNLLEGNVTDGFKAKTYQAYGNTGSGNYTVTPDEEES